MTADRDAFLIEDRGTAIITSALHAGHDVRGALTGLFALSDAERLREEDPFTEAIADLGVSRIVVSRSRFEVDLNRSRETSVYLRPDDAWGLDIWSSPLSDTLAEESRCIHDAFYAAVGTLLDEAVESHGGFVLLDVHSYNHRRGGADAAPADPLTDPEVNLGTESLDAPAARPFVESFVRSMTDAGYDCRENVKFRGGNFVRWVNSTYRDQGFALAIEFKKTFMDEWSGAVDPAALLRANAALRTAAASLGRILREQAG